MDSMPDTVLVMPDLQYRIGSAHKVRTHKSTRLDPRTHPYVYARARVAFQVGAPKAGVCF